MKKRLRVRGRSARSSGKPTSEGWYKLEDAKGMYFTPFRSEHRTYFPLPVDQKETCDILNKNRDWELHEAGAIAFEHRYVQHGEGEVSLPNGIYFLEKEFHTEEQLRPLDMREDRLIRVPGLSGRIIEDIRNFLGSEERYRVLGVQYRMGILLYGPPGNGKTLLIRDIIRNELPVDAVVVFLSDLPSTAFLQAVKRTLKGRLKVIVFEELVGVVNRSRIDRILDFLDGETSLDEALIFATTNYPEQLPGNIVDRPSRFDKVYPLAEPDEEARRVILRFFLKRSPKDDEIRGTNGFSCADLKEVVLLNRIRGIDFSAAVEHIRAHQKLVDKQFAKSKPIGIREDLEF